MLSEIKTRGYPVQEFLEFLFVPWETSETVLYPDS